MTACAAPISACKARLAALARRRQRTHICRMSVAAKICGLSSEEAVAAAIEGGAAWLGFVFYPPSPRSVSPARAAALCEAVPASVQRVGLFVDADDAAIEVALNAAPLDILQ